MMDTLPSSNPHIVSDEAQGAQPMTPLDLNDHPAVLVDKALGKMQRGYPSDRMAQSTLSQDEGTCPCEGMCNLTLNHEFIDV